MHNRTENDAMTAPITPSLTDAELGGIAEGNPPHNMHYVDAMTRMARELLAYRRAGVADVPDYDAGLLNDWGGGNVDWWQDYLRAEIGRSNDHWRVALTPPPASRADADLRAAMTEANDLLRSTAQVLKRVVLDERMQGVVADWDALHDRVIVHLRRTHAVTNEARAALSTPAPSRPDADGGAV